MKVVVLAVISVLGLWYNGRATLGWWSLQKSRFPASSDVFGWVGVGFSALWYLFVFAFFAGLTLNNTIFR